MKALSEEMISEITRILSIEMDCYLNPKTDRLISVPLPESSFYKHEMWQEIIQETKATPEAFIVFNSFRSADTLKVMQNFIASLDNKYLQEELEVAISQLHPFLRFREKIERIPDYWEQWLDFSKNSYKEYINSVYKAEIGKFI